MSDRDGFQDWERLAKEQLFRLARNFEKGFSKDLLEDWLVALCEVPLKEIELSVNRCIADSERQFKPKLGEFWGYVHPNWRPSKVFDDAPEPGWYDLHDAKCGKNFNPDTDEGERIALEAARLWNYEYTPQMLEFFNRCRYPAPMRPDAPTQRLEEAS